MKTSFHRIYTKDNLELVGLLYEPETAVKKILVHVHGMAGNFYENKFLDFIAQTLTSKGVAFFAFNNRGCELVKDLTKIENGKRTFARIGNAYEKFEDCLLDIEAAIDFAVAKGFSEIHLSGHSLGGPKVAYYGAERQDDRLASFIFLSPADMVGLIKADKNYQRDNEMARKMVAEGRGGELLPFPVLWDASPISAATYISISGEESKVAIFNLYNPNDSLSVLGTITTPAFTVMGRKDDALTVPAEELMKRIEQAMTASPKVATHILGDADHGFNNYEQQLADVIAQWIVELEK